MNAFKLFEWLAEYYQKNKRKKNIWLAEKDKKTLAYALSNARVEGRIWACRFYRS